MLYNPNNGVWFCQQHARRGDGHRAAPFKQKDDRKRARRVMLSVHRRRLSTEPSELGVRLTSSEDQVPHVEYTPCSMDRLLWIYLEEHSPDNDRLRQASSHRSPPVNAIKVRGQHNHAGYCMHRRCRPQNICCHQLQQGTLKRCFVEVKR